MQWNGQMLDQVGPYQGPNKPLVSYLRYLILSATYIHPLYKAVYLSSDDNDEGVCFEIKNK